jgi:hypothetical protein
MALTAKGATLSRDVRALLRLAVGEAAASYGPTERLLGYRLPDEWEIHELAARVVPLLERREIYTDDADWRAQMFGAAISAVVRKEAGRSKPAQNVFRREMIVEADGLVRERPDGNALAGGLGTPLLPDLQEAEDGAAIAPWFPPEDWHFVREESGLRTLANLGRNARIEVAPRAGRTLLVVRYFAVVTGGMPYRVRVWGGGRMLDEQQVVLQESRLVRAVVPEDCSEIIVEIATEDDPRVDPPWRLRIGVCQLFAAE